MKYTVTRDQAQDSHLSNISIAVWEDDCWAKVHMNSDGEWEALSVESVIITECTPEEFELEYGIVPPKAGSKSVLIAEYSWE
jgi:hypothetical protein